jgi:hypothetical protein
LYLGAVLQQVAVIGAHDLSTNAAVLVAAHGVLNAVDQGKALAISGQGDLEVPALKDWRNDWWEAYRLPRRWADINQ